VTKSRSEGVELAKQEMLHRTEKSFTTRERTLETLERSSSFLDLTFSDLQCLSHPIVCLQSLVTSNRLWPARCIILKMLLPPAPKIKMLHDNLKHHLLRRADLRYRDPRLDNVSASLI
jgi:hypothetical protein